MNQNKFFRIINITHIPKKRDKDKSATKSSAYVRSTIIPQYKYEIVMRILIMFYGVDY